jgi:hypothetical protein
MNMPGGMGKGGVPMPMPMGMGPMGPMGMMRPPMAQMPMMRPGLLGRKCERRVGFCVQECPAKSLDSLKI